MNLEYEKYVFDYYLKVCQWIQEQLYEISTLEQDLELLQSGEPNNPNPPISFELRMAIVYRSEKKKIIASQISLLKQVISILERLESVITPGDEESSRKPYQKLLLEETEDEAERRAKIE